MAKLGGSAFGIKGLLVAVVLAGLAFLGWQWWQHWQGGEIVDSYQACVDAGNPVQESYPEVCRSKDGKSFTNPGQ